MTQCSVITGKFQKSARLLKHRDFRFRKYQILRRDCFNFIFNLEGKTRLGISLSKKNLRLAVARNRVRRLFKEVFRSKIKYLSGIDLHVVGKAPLQEQWRFLSRMTVEKEIDWLIATFNPERNSKDFD